MLQKLSGEVLLAIGGVCIFATCALYIFTGNQTPTVVHPQGLSSFELGEYYFNHSDNGSVYDTKLAKEFYSKALAEEPKNPLVLYQLGRIQFIEGDFNAAIATFDTQIERFSDRIPNVYYMLGLAYGYRARALGNPDDWEQAEQAFSDFIHYAPQSPWPRVDLAWVYFAQGKYDQMEPVLEEGLVHRPDNPWLRNMYGLYFLNTGQKEQALEQFLLADQEAAQLTAEDWGLSYPGNDPSLWQQGIDEFRSLIEANIELAKK